MLSLLFFSAAHATSPQEHARQLQQQTQNIAQTTSPDTIPGFKTDAPPEVIFNDHHALEAATEKAFSQNEAAGFLQHSAETRPYFRIDQACDPLITNSIDSIQNPEKVLDHPTQNREAVTEFDIKTCQESKPATEITCSKILLPPEFWVEPAKSSRFWCLMGKHLPDDPSCEAKIAYPTPRVYQEERIHIQPEAWTSTCQEMEAKSREGMICKLIKQECVSGRETRNVMGTMSGAVVSRPITRDCWRYDLTYICSHPSPNTCESLRNNACEQIKSKCLRKIDNKRGGLCVEWKQTYRCPTKKGADQKRQIASAYGKVEAMPPVTEAPNGDLNEAISKLQILREVQDELRAGGSATELPLIFKGCSKACTIAFAGFANCCSDGKGWGVSLGLSGCDGEEQDLAERQKKSLCHEVGTFCAAKEPLTKICLRKKRRYCCFPSKLSRILHEQGRAQLGIGWGKPKSPDCRGFTADELARINFDQLNLSEIFAEVAARMRSTTVDVVKRNFSDRVNQMTRSFRNRPQGGDQ